MCSLDTEMPQKFQDAILYGARGVCRHGILLLRWTRDEFEV
jgi:hypothetical protein